VHGAEVGCARGLVLIATDARARLVAAIGGGLQASLIRDDGRVVVAGLDTMIKQVGHGVLEKARVPTRGTRRGIRLAGLAAGRALERHHHDLDGGRALRGDHRGLLRARRRDGGA